MIEINLLPLELRGGKEKKELALPGLPSKRTMVLILIVALALEAALAGLVFVRKGQLAGLEAERKKLDPIAQRIQTIKAETARLEARSQELAQATARRVRWTELLNAVSDGMTDDVWLTKIGVKREVKIVSEKESRGARRLGAKDRVKKEDDEKKKREIDRPVTKYLMVLNGTVSPKADSTSAVGRFITNLESDPVMQKHFSKVWLEKIDRVVEDNVERFDFTVSCLFNKEAGADFDGVF